MGYLNGIAFAFKEMGEFTKAESLFEIAHRLDQGSFLTSVFLAKMYLENGKCEKAIPLLKKLPRNFPVKGVVTPLLADAYYDCRNFSKALEEYLRIPTFPPKSASIYLKIGKCYEDLKQYDNAAAYLDTAIEKSDNKLSTFYHIINMYIIAEQYKEAKKYAKAAFDLAPDDPKLFTMTGDIYSGYGAKQRKDEEYGTAISNYNTAIACFKKAGKSSHKIRSAETLIKEMQSASGIISGKITQKSNGMLLPFTNIVIRRTKKGTVTNLKGEYSISLLPGTYDIQARMMGYVNITVKGVKVKKDQTTIVNFELEVEKIKNPKAIIYAPSPP